MKTFIVACTCLINCETVLERIEASNWKEAVQKHTKYPFKAYPEHEEEFRSVDEVIEQTDEQEDDFKDHCFACDCLMEWIEM